VRNGDHETVLNDVWNEGAPCYNDPTFSQQGEAANWTNTPEAAAAINTCNTICRRLKPCAKQGLAAGTIDGERFASVADGVIYGGIACTGDHATLLALHAVAGTTPSDTHCLGCEREFLDPTVTVAKIGQCRRSALGFCSACYKSKRNSGALPQIRNTTPAACTDCQTALVPKGTTPTAGTAEHRGGGRCATCANAHSYQQRKAAA